MIKVVRNENNRIILKCKYLYFTINFWLTLFIDIKIFFDKRTNVNSNLNFDKSADIYSFTFQNKKELCKYMLCSVSITHSGFVGCYQSCLLLHERIAYEISNAITYTITRILH